MGNNAFGACYFRALLAYDCTANPNHKAKDAAHRIWDCLQQVKIVRRRRRLHLR